MMRWFGKKKLDAPTRPWVIDPSGLLFDVSDDPLEGRRLLLEQLVGDDFAHQRGGRILVPWDAAIALRVSETYPDAAPILEIPRPAPWVPMLVSTGTPSDHSFSIKVAGWTDGTRERRPMDVECLGATIAVEGETFLLGAAAWRILRELDFLATHGATEAPELRMLRIGRIQSLASDAGAVLDGYLSKTRFIASERMAIDLRVEEALDESVVELVPHPEGAPEAIVRAIDLFDSVRPRYDVVLPDGGIAHVSLSPSVQQVLEPIKAMPGRRVAGRAAEHFLENPCAFLGDDAASTLDLPRFEEAVRRSDALPRVLEAEEAPDGLLVRAVSESGHPDHEFSRVDAAEARELLQRAAAAQSSGRASFSWKKVRIGLDGRSQTALSTIQRWVAGRTADSKGLTISDVFDLGAYSDRVAGFDGKPIHVPVITRPGAAGEWLPADVEAGLLRIDPVTGTAQVVPVSKEVRQQIANEVARAKSDGRKSVRVPGIPEDVAIPDAEAFLRKWKDADDPRRLESPANPKPRDTPSLRIHYNIESLEYGAEVLPPPTGELRPRLPAALRSDVVLKPHQLQGLAVLQHRFGQRGLGVRGLLLADDMGLGKTLQSLAFLAWYAETAPDPHPCLVVAPVSLLDNWRAEIRKFLNVPENRILSLYGDELGKHRLRESELDSDLRALGLKKFLRDGFAADRWLVLTTYETLRDYEFSMGRVQWGVFVCDEAQKIKTPGTLVTRAAKAMKAEFSIACTGTPVENSLADYWCLFDFFQPGLLGSLNVFSRTFRQTIERREAGHEEQLDVLRRSTLPWVLRRMKHEVVDLPPKIDAEHHEAAKVRAELPMSPLQRRLYMDEARRLKAMLEPGAMSAEPGAVLGVLHKLRQVCTNPLALIDPLASMQPVNAHLEVNPKLAWTIAQLDHIRSFGEKAILFTEFRDLQRLLQRAVGERFAIDVPIVNGDTPASADYSESRQAMIDAFQAKPGFGVIILSTMAVGFGVNVQQANHVIHFTRPWNPAKEDQATDRAYRIGQERTVYVYTPTVIGDGFESFEQRVAARLAARRSLSRDMLAPEQTLTIKDFEGLVID